MSNNELIEQLCFIEDVFENYGDLDIIHVARNLVTEGSSFFEDIKRILKSKIREGEHE